MRDKEQRKEYDRKYREEHKEQRKEYNRKYNEEHKEEIKKYYEEHKEEIKKYYEEHKEQINEYQRKYKEKHKEQINEYQRKYREENKEYFRKYWEEHKEEMKEYGRKYYEEIRNTLINVLGKKCVECGNNDDQLLQIHHINGDGQKDREENNNLYLHYINNPDEARQKLQILCSNCHRKWHRIWRETVLRVKIF